MVKSVNWLMIFFIVSFTVFISFKYVLADNNVILDPTVQFNQSGQPYVVWGGTPSGDYNNLNVMGEGLTYDIPEAQDGGLYRVEAWHNSSQVADGNILSVNATINFTSNISKDYSLQIYDFANSRWTSDGCDSGTISAGVFTEFWCNETFNPTNYNSSDRKIMIRLNSTPDSNPALLREDYVQYYVSYESGYLEVNITNPDPALINDAIQGYTFPVNATVTCRDGPCGEVFGTVRYNSSSLNPDTTVSINVGDKPLYVQEGSPYAVKSCGILYRDQRCQLNWTINATGDVNTNWKIGVLFNSSYSEVQENHTSNATISILPCTVDIDVSWSSINFGLLNPDTGPYDAPENSNNGYNITVKDGSCDTDLYIKGTDLTSSAGSFIGVGNATWSSASNSYSSSSSLSNTDQLIQLKVQPRTSITTWYWINVPAVFAGYYNGTITITGVKNE